MTAYPSPYSRRQSPLPLLMAGAAFALATYLVLDRSGWFQYAPTPEPRPITPRGDLMEFEKTTTSIFEQFAPAVVHITTEAMAHTMFGVQRYQEGTGTGFLWDETGTVVTNYHVVKTVVERRSRLKIALGDELYDGTVLGDSPVHDIAVLRIASPPKNLRPIPIGSSADLKVGQYVLAIGNPYGFDRSLSTGIISALNRNIATENSTKMVGLIQTDAAINPGNSGGPLLDSAGRLIGMNTAIYSPSGTSAGIGFAVPVDTINEIVPGLLDGSSSQRFLGITIGEPVRVDRRSGFAIGLPILGAETENETAGVRAFRLDNQERLVAWGDILVAVDGAPIRNLAELQKQLRGRRRGEKVKVTVLRGEPGTMQPVELGVSIK